MYDKYIINEQQAQSYIEVNARRRQMVDFCAEKYDYYMNVAVDYYLAGKNKKADQFVEYAREWRLAAAKIADEQRTTDQVVNLIWLGEIDDTNQW
jgi:hypothetical protein